MRSSEAGGASVVVSPTVTVVAAAGASLFAASVVGASEEVAADCSVAGTVIGSSEGEIVSTRLIDWMSFEELEIVSVCIAGALLVCAASSIEDLGAASVD